MSHSLTDKILHTAEQQTRVIVAIAGPPGAGKSTLSESLCKEILAVGKRCCVVPMDGFHLDNSVLAAKNLTSRKGSPATFDAEGFVSILARIFANNGDVYVPVFDRDRDIAIAGAQLVSTSDEVVLVEGNYLLLNQKPWSALRQYFSTTVFLDPGMATIESRILERWQSAGLDSASIQQRTYGNDLPNAEFVMKNSLLTESTTIIA